MLNTEADRYVQIDTINHTIQFSFCSSKHVSLLILVEGKKYLREKE